LDSTKPSGSIKIRVETIVHYMAKYSQEIIEKKMRWLSPECPVGRGGSQKLEVRSIEEAKKLIGVSSQPTA
jgi:hypothetical protein